jgi:hypothetical protein
VTYDLIKRSFYFWYFRLQRIIEGSIAANDFEFIDRIWGDWSPGYDASEDLPLVKDRIRDPAHLQTALGYYDVVTPRCVPGRGRMYSRSSRRSPRAT